MKKQTNKQTKTNKQTNKNKQTKQQTKQNKTKHKHTPHTKYINQIKDEETQTKKQISLSPIRYQICQS